MGQEGRPGELSVLLPHPLRTASGFLTITLDLATTVLVYLSCHGYWANVFSTPEWNRIMLRGKYITQQAPSPGEHG